MSWLNDEVSVFMVCSALVLAVIFGGKVGLEAYPKQCDMLGKFEHAGVVYECGRVGK